MAMGNIGNLLQHFVHLTVANQLVSDWNQPQNPIEYIDCFSIAPRRNLGTHVLCCLHTAGRTPFPAMLPHDSVAVAFQSAWTDKYKPAAIPTTSTNANTRTRPCFCTAHIRNNVGICGCTIFTTGTNSSCSNGWTDSRALATFR